MKVVFLESVEGTAQVGEVKDVKKGFARNFLLPRGLAAAAVEPYLARANASAKREAKQQDALDEDAKTTAERLEGTRITMWARVGEQGKLYGSVTNIHIAEEVAKLVGQEEFDHRKVLLPGSIKEVGIQPVRLRLTRNVEAAIEVEVIAEGEEPAGEEAEDAEEGAETAATAEDEAPAEATVEESAEEEAEEAETEEASGEDVSEGAAPEDAAEDVDDKAAADEASTEEAEDEEDEEEEPT